MAELDSDVMQDQAKSESSRARQRKMKRERGSDFVQEQGAEMNSTRRSRTRKSMQGGPSVRERLASARINIHTPELKSLQGKFDSTIKRVSQLPDPGEVVRKTINDFGSTKSINRHRGEISPRENRYKATSRAETQRKSSSNQPLMPRKNRRQFDARSEAVPPVMVRGGMGGMAFGRVASSRMRKQKQPKRRFDVPLNIPGAEVRLPSVPLIHVGWRAVSLLMVIMMTACLFLMWKAPVFQVNSVEAEGLQRLTAGDLNTVMGTFGKSVFSLDPKVLEQALQQAFPELSKVAVRINLPAKVMVSVTEREPVISWNHEGTETWVDVEGISFPPRGTPAKPLVTVDGYGEPPSAQSGIPDAEQAPLPEGSASIITAPKTPTLRLSPELVTAILAMGASMPADTMLVYDSEHGLGWDDPNGWEVYFGIDNQDMEMKLVVYEALVEQLQNEGIQPAIISVEYVHAPYYRMER